MFKMSSFNNQKATTYIAYMMVGSIFHKTYLVNQGQAKRLYLEYREMPVKNQIKTEELILSLLKRKSMGDISRFENLNCEVEIRKEEFYKAESYYEVRFDTKGFGSIIIRVDKNGRVDMYVREEAEASF